MSAAPSSRRRDAAYADLAEVPPHLVAELLGGTVYASPRPAARHARATTRLGIDLGGAFDRGRDGPGGWVLLYEPELHLGADVLVPDLAGWRRERMPEIPDVAAFTLAPDWVCEVLSPATAAVDRAEKMPRYAQALVPHLWLIDPMVGTLEVYRLVAPGWHLVATHAGDVQVRAEPFELVSIDLAALWEP